jgi:signal transduction histidine kinase
VSHELRTPLNCIKESINLLNDEIPGKITDEQRKVLSVAARNMERLTRLINDVLALSKIESKEFRLNPTPFRLQNLLEFATDTFQAWAGSKDITLEMKAPEEPIELEADQDQINQVLVNLIGNAVKFTPAKGKVTIEAKTILQGEATSSGYVQIAVIDTGIGIPAAEQGKIFEKFTQGASAKKVSAMGTGLGLTISKEIVDMHGGRIWVESEEGKGSRFIFVVPQKVRQATVPQAS